MSTRFNTIVQRANIINCTIVQYVTKLTTTYSIYNSQWPPLPPSNIIWVIQKNSKLTVGSNGLSEAEEGGGDNKVADPGGGGCQGGAGATGPQWIDLGVDGPGHGGHTYGVSFPWQQKKGDT